MLKTSRSQFRFTLLLCLLPFVVAFAALALYLRMRVNERALIAAVRSGDAASVERLLRAGASPEARSGSEDSERGLANTTPLAIASRNGDEAMVRLLLARGANASAKSLPETGESHDIVLSNAVRSGNLSVVRLLLDAGANPNVKGAGGHTPIMFAAKANFPQIVQLLIDRGAALDVHDDQGLDIVKFMMRSQDNDLRGVVAVLKRNGVKGL